MKTLYALILAVLMLTSSALAQDASKTVAAEYPFLSSGALGSATLSALPKGIILRSGELTLTQKDLDAEIRKSPESMRPQLKQNLFFVLENKTTQTLFTWEALSWAKTQKTAPKDEDSLIRAYFESITSGVSVNDEELKNFFAANKDMIGDATFDQTKDQLKDYVLEQKRSNAAQARINSLSERYEVELDKNWVAKQNSAAMNNPVDKARKSGKPSLVDFGADGCRPCDMLAPILESLKKQYAGKLNVLFVHVRKEEILAARYGVQSIPVQVFYDKDGKEVFRHVGFFAKEKIEAKLAEMGVK
ncbi:MAG: thioredoxin family protein [Armatimonadota bacterium]|nr:thioredoxin family protein [bacterium]